MGNKNNKSKKKPKLTSPPTLDELPVEILYKILDELDISTIFISLYHVCKRFDEILSSYNNYHLNFKNISLTNFNLICSRIRPEQITDLTLSDDENNVELIELFLSKFSLHTFIRLHTLTLIQINNEEYLNQILISIADRNSLVNFSSIKIINTDETYGDLFIEVIMTVLTKPSLRQVYFDLSYSRTTSNPLPWLEQCSIKQLTFQGTCTFNFVRNTLICLPILETFQADDFDFDEEIDLNHIPTHQDDDSFEENELEIENELTRKVQFASIESINNLKSLKLNACSMSMSKLEWLLQELITLKIFHLITAPLYDDESILDGHRWESLVSNMEKFQFVFSVNISNDSKWDTDICLIKFQTSFWINEKQWFITLEKYDDEIILYTLPYLNNFFVLKNESNLFEYRSTANENLLLQIQSMNNVHDLYIDASNMKKSQLENSTIPRFSHVTDLYLYGKWPKSKTFFTDIQTIIDLNNVEKLIRDECIPTMDFIALLNLMPNLQSIKTTTTLLDALNAAKFCHTKCLRSFVIDPNCYDDQRPVNIEPFCAMFPRIEKLIIPIDNVDSCRYVLDQLNQDLISVNFRIPSNDSVLIESENENEEENLIDDVFSEWIKELPKQYRCQKKQQQIHIWIK